MQVPEKKPIVELPTEQQVNEISDLLEDFDKKAFYILNGKKKENFEQKIDVIPLTFRFTDFFNTLCSIRRDMVNEESLDKTRIFPDMIQTVAKVFNKGNIIEWMQQPLSNIFTWTDYVRSYYSVIELAHFSLNLQFNGKVGGESFMQPARIITNLSEDTAKNQRQFLMGICLFFYQTNAPALELDEHFESFMSHEPIDYSRPSAFLTKPDYFSYGDLVSLVWKRKSTETDFTQSERDSIRKFTKEYHSFGGKDLTIPENLKIPYDLYSRSFDELNYAKAIQPHSVEICFYYVLQNDLPDENIWQVKANPHHTAVPSFRNITCPPNLKWFNIHDLQRVLITWRLYHKLTQNDTTFNTKKLFQDFGKQIGYEMPWNDHRWGLLSTDCTIPYKDRLERYFEYFGEFINHVTECILYIGGIQQSFKMCTQLQISENHEAKMALVATSMRHFYKNFSKQYKKIEAWSWNIKEIPMPHHWVDEYDGPLSLSHFFFIYAQNFPISPFLLDAIKFFNGFLKNPVTDIPFMTQQSWIFNDLIAEAELGYTKSNLAMLQNSLFFASIDVEKIHGLVKDYFPKLTVFKMLQKFKSKITISLRVQKEQVLMSEAPQSNKVLEAFRVASEVDALMEWLKKQRKKHLEKLDERDGFNNGGFKPNGGQDGWPAPMPNTNVEFNNNGTQDNNGIFLPNQGGETNPFIGTERVNEVDVIPQDKKEEVKEKAKRAWGVALGKDALVGADLKKQNKRNYYLG